MQIGPEYQLQQVTVRCPVTQLPVATGVQLSAAAFATALFTNVRVQCPHCEGEHRWSSADAFLTEVGSGDTPPETHTFGRRPPTGGFKRAPRPLPATEAATEA